MEIEFGLRADGMPIQVETENIKLIDIYDAQKLYIPGYGAVETGQIYVQVLHDDFIEDNRKWSYAEVKEERDRLATLGYGVKMRPNGEGSDPIDFPNPSSLLLSKDYCVHRIGVSSKGYVLNFKIPRIEVAEAIADVEQWNDQLKLLTKNEVISKNWRYERNGRVWYDFTILRLENKKL